MNGDASPNLNPECELLNPSSWRVLSACSTDFFMGVKRPKVVQCQTRMMVGKGSWFSVYAFRRLCRQTDFWPNRRNLSGETHCEKMGQPFLAMKDSVRRRMTLVRARHNVTAEASAQGVDVRPRRCDVESSESDGRFQRAESGQPHGSDWDGTDSFVVRAAKPSDGFVRVI